MNKEEISTILTNHVKTMFNNENSDIKVELISKPRVGLVASITVSPKEEKKVEAKEVPKKKELTPLESLVEEEVEENKEKVVTTGSLFSKLSS